MSKAELAAKCYEQAVSLGWDKVDALCMVCDVFSHTFYDRANLFKEVIKLIK